MFLPIWLVQSPLHVQILLCFYVRITDHFDGSYLRKDKPSIHIFLKAFCLHLQIRDAIPKYPCCHSFHRGNILFLSVLCFPCCFHPFDTYSHINPPAVFLFPLRQLKIFPLLIFNSLAASVALSK